MSPRASRVWQTITLGALVFGLTFSFLRYDCLLFLVMLAGFATTVLLRVALLLDAIISKWRRRPSPHLATAWIPLAVLLAAGSSYRLRVPFLRTGAALRLEIHRADYEAAVSRMRAGSANDDTIYLWSHTPRPLYFFSWGGMTDNLCGILHDEAQDLASTPGNALGIWLISRVHLWGPWCYVETTWIPSAGAIRSAQPVDGPATRRRGPWPLEQQVRARHARPRHADPRRHGRFRRVRDRNAPPRRPRCPRLRGRE